ncbi:MULTISPECIES: DUF4424 family protein [unclassified Janthinobacterium]|uniref:DUF4424 family protein n=1 Tax=unclassified Janthinobacterium TaxID=2610881 RepID=UPI00160BEF59|nr:MULTISPECIES: DUF4424 family protein [unclassified Janthinobacterium]MBB5370716.1 hypothetical protein [Janthinobacterium sp. K2C7]MBB5383522.1 hypothetical protein [Janthinobacterium sp. K2Li3]MBB5388976.1 hypothetical protein [Janthinobacterium sp. K2E3]
MGAADFRLAAPPGAGIGQGRLMGVRTLVATLALLFAAPALANDGIAAQSAGGIVFGKTDAVAMKKEVLSVSADLIKVDYEFLNESGKDVEETIFFPLPEYAAGYHGSPTYYGQPQQFSVEVDGKDVTARLRALGLTDPQIAYFPSHTPFDKKIAPLSESQRAAMIKEGLLGQLYDEEWVPAWTVKVIYLWQQKFPAGKVVWVRHQYAPFVAAGSAATYLGDDKEFEKKYCTDQGFQKTWQRLAARAGENGVVNAVAVSYILTTGNTWKNGIEDFTLNLIKGKPDELVSLCFPGTFTRINPTTLQVRLRHFRPRQDLDVYFGNVAGMGQHGGVAPVIRP